MPKFNISQRRMLTQTASRDVDLPEGVIPVEWVQTEQTEGRDPFEGSWEDQSSSYLSIDVSPIAPDPEPEPEPEPGVDPVEDEPDTDTDGDTNEPA